MQKTAKLFPNGRSQAVRLPKEFQFEGEEVFIEKVGDKVILSAKPSSWDSFFSSELKATDDFMCDIADDKPQERDLF
ncbi:antitoxin [Spartinivicinus poritis]|uniref:Type II toxin-antitoxin system VapB family antitoxin n=1 Tax=Spartinivicinus poritis TaxID=2994640 RepID=A0ABT5UGU2_9GAMM|nr:type II toxin-antitoxin system VapB family antitoxin [Spartinivicinus sp. A2-2]MDE1465527.1 type II toxin-antitoxin system VapB family antitoxin [Spartinivicinus sp. A2-2]